MQVTEDKIAFVTKEVSLSTCSLVFYMVKRGAVDGRAADVLDASDAP